MPERFNRWDYFWSEYMVWTLRAVCCFADFHFFGPFYARYKGVWQAEVLIWLYGIACLLAIETAVNRRYDRDYTSLQLTKAQLKYRTGRERILLSAFLFCALNCMLGVIVSLFIGGAVGIYILEGILSVIGSLAFCFIGIICLVGRDQATGKRMPRLYFPGLAAFALPTAYVLMMAVRIFVK